MKLNIKNNLIRVNVDKIIPNVMGIASITQDGYHAMFFDFDNTTNRKIKVTIRKMQVDYRLSDFYTFKSSKNNYHAICLDKMTQGMIIDIHNTIKNYDSKHDIHSIKRGYWVLRTTPKQKNQIKYLKTIKNKLKSKWSKSNAHRKFLEKAYDLKITKDNLFDNHEKIRYDTYSTIARKI